jgi:hypothetical protein
MKPLFDELIAKLRKELDFEYKIGKTYIGLIHKLVFVGLYIQMDTIIVEFVARKVFKSPRIKKVFDSGRNRWAYFFDVKESKDINEQLLNWIKQSYE